MLTCAGVVEMPSDAAQGRRERRYAQGPQQHHAGRHQQAGYEQPPSAAVLAGRLCEVCGARPHEACVLLPRSPLHQMCLVLPSRQQPFGGRQAEQMLRQTRRTTLHRLDVQKMSANTAAKSFLRTIHERTAGLA